jgi:hypothetical protein
VLFDLRAREPRLQLFLFYCLILSTEEETTVLDEIVFMALEKVIYQIVQLRYITIY